ncbi:MAG: glycoside hydrolase family 127 protein, partial [Treponema sp.]|nr:glycoside hydrolase family 127 protein [Treponema sp.]
ESFYLDTVERALYNTVRAGVSLEGDRYFYVNPLEVWPEICVDHSSRSHVKPVRQKWFDVACCPTNAARTFGSLGQYIYSLSDRSLFVNLFIQNTASFTVGGREVSLSLETDYPRTGKVAIRVDGRGAEFSLLIRRPGFARNFSAAVNGAEGDGVFRGGYCRIRRIWNHDEVLVSFDLRAELVYANPLVRANCGKAALVRGPEVYCLEETDNGRNLASVYLDEGAEPEEEWREDLLGGTVVIRLRGKKLSAPGMVPSFSAGDKQTFTDTVLTAVPYGSWGNREKGEMIVWMRRLFAGSRS